MLTSMDLKIERIKNQKTATELSEHLGVSNSYVCLMEQGKRTISTEIYEKWLLFLKIKYKENVD